MSRLIEHACSQLLQAALATVFIAWAIGALREGGTLAPAFLLVLGLATVIEIPLANARFRRKDAP